MYLALILVIFTPPAFGVSDLDKFLLSSAQLANSFGNTMTGNININQQVQITATVTNNHNTSQEFVYIVQIKDENDVIIYLQTFSGIELLPSQSFSPSLSWLPDKAGTYKAEIYVWDTINPRVNANALSYPTSLGIIVS